MADAVREWVEPSGPWRMVWKQLRRDWVAVGAAVVILAIVGLAVCAPLVAQVTRHGVDTQYRTTGLTADGLPRPPSREF